MTASSIPLPAGWPQRVRSAVLHVAALARGALVSARAQCASQLSPLTRLRARCDELESALAQLREELRIKDARMLAIEPRKRPHYPPTERLAILALRAACGWNAAETARRFLVTPTTIADWMSRLDEGGEDALVQVPVPVNRFPDFVAHLVQQLRTTLPSAGRRRIADTLARAGLCLAASTARRLAKRKLPPPPPETSTTAPEVVAAPRKPTKVTATAPHQVWHVDITVVSTLAGFWVPWMPFALAQRWPFSWHVAVVLDHFSRAVVHAGVFLREPTAAQTCRLLEQAARSVGGAPSYVVTDQGTQFGSEYLDWGERNDVTPRYGAIGQHGSIAIVERFMRTLKQEGLRRILIPLSLSRMRAEVAAFCLWYNSTS